MLTEEEAKTRWCPFTRITASETEWHTNRPSIAEVQDKGFDLCAGTKCMAWRFDNEKLGHSLAHHMSTMREADARRAHAKFHQEQPLRGFCGLAGERS